MEVVIEIIEPGRRAPSIKRFDQSEISIGRGWDNDLVIADPQVDAAHCTLRFDEESRDFAIEDLSTANGTRQDREPVKGSVGAFFGSTITVGQTSFRVHRRADAVAPARVYSRSENILEKMSLPATAISIAALAVLLTQYMSYFGGGRDFEWNSELQGLITTATALVVWALFWGLMTKLFKHQFKVWPHLGLAACVTLLSLLFTEIQGVVSFNTLSTSVTAFVGAMNTSIMIFIWVVFGLLITTNLKLNPRLMTASALVGLFLLTSFLLPRLQTQSWVNLVPLETKSLPTSFHLSPGMPQADFFQLLDENLNESEERAIEVREEQAKEEQERREKLGALTKNS